MLLLDALQPGLPLLLAFLSPLGFLVAGATCFSAIDEKPKQHNEGCSLVYFLTRLHLSCKWLWSDG